MLKELNMTNPRVQAYFDMIEAIDKLHEDDDIDLVSNDVDASSADFANWSPEVQAVAIALKKLDDLTPLERVPEKGVVETLVLERRFSTDRERSSDWLLVRNSLGVRETIRNFPISRYFALEHDKWSSCRENSEIADTSWDDARKERHVVSKIGLNEAVDRGLNFVFNLIQKAECDFQRGSEGHPEGAFVVFDGCGSYFFAITDEFERLGWRVHFDEEMPQFVTIRMPKVETVEARDAEWRKLSRDFNYDLLPSAGMTPR